jgi:hypothetical protein
MLNWHDSRGLINSDRGLIEEILDFIAILGFN